LESVLEFVVETILELNEKFIGNSRCLVREIFSSGIKKHIVLRVSIKLPIDGFVLDAVLTEFHLRTVVKLGI
jgi:uncharacterized Fe-S cluster-containing radical SAM superfamily protein